MKIEAKYGTRTEKSILYLGLFIREFAVLVVVKILKNVEKIFFVSLFLFLFSLLSIAACHEKTDKKSKSRSWHGK